MIERNFKVIKGGNDGVSKAAFEKRSFVSAYVTDTRLMGVLALSIHWSIPTASDNTDFHQFFYFDAEEYGLDTYQSIEGDDLLSLEMVEQGLMGGLGGKKVALTQKETLFLLQSFATESKNMGVPLPEPTSEYEDLLSPEQSLSQKEIQVVINKTCTKIVSDYQLIHYFLMRCFAKDWIGASYLIGPGAEKIDLEKIADTKASTLYKNTIEEYENNNGTLSYLCEAAIDIDGKYQLIVLEITTEKNKISSACRRSSFRISPAEAAMMLNRPEFITVFEILATPEEFDEKFLPMTKATIQSHHDNGRLFMEFNKNNDHVNRKTFCLNEDVWGLYYVSDFGQLIIAAYGLNEIHSIEQALQKSPLNTLLLPNAKFEFKEPVLYDFIQSDFEDFEDFLLSLQ